jgi:methylmalonyl-CoA mutase cobalamin-binding domain/chain
MSNINEQIATPSTTATATVEQLAQLVLDQNIDPNEAINREESCAGKAREAFDNLEVFLPELMLGGEAMKVLIDKLSVRFEGEGGGYRGTVVIGCAKGDLHDIGKNLVATQLSVNGFKVFDLGTDVSVNNFIDKAHEVDADIIAVSSLLTTSAYYQEELIKRLETEGLRSKYKVIVGGGPITPAWTRNIGADGYSRTAHLAVDLCKALVEGGNSETLIFE